MLAERPPAEIIHFFDFVVGAFKKRDFFAQPIPGIRVGNEICDIFVLHRIEAIDVMRKGIGLEDRLSGKCGITAEKETKATK
jgi:hypothetical protein